MGRHQAAEPKFTFICSPDELLGVLRADAGAKELRCQLAKRWNNEMFVEVAEALRDNSYLQSFEWHDYGNNLGDEGVLLMATQRSWASFMWMDPCWTPSGSSLGVARAVAVNL